jgi:hypothetical protein
MKNAEDKNTNVKNIVQDIKDLAQNVQDVKQNIENAHNVRLTIKNNTSEPLVYIPEPWFQSGALEKEMTFKDVQPKEGSEVFFIHGESGGCSGYVMFTHKVMKLVTIAFANPLVGENKIGVEIGKAHNPKYDVLDKMNSHYDNTCKPAVTCTGAVCSFSNTSGKIDDAIVEFWDL